MWMFCHKKSGESFDIYWNFDYTIFLSVFNTGEEVKVFKIFNFIFVQSNFSGLGIVSSVDNHENFF